MDSVEEKCLNLTPEELRRQSIDRFDDKLVENILSYLTFSEKVLFESVSKQWKRSVYNQQKELHLTRWETEGNDTLNKLLEPLEVTDFTTASAEANGLKRINKFSLNLVLKKCKSVEKVILDCFVDLEDLDIICRNSPKLRSIELDTTGLNANDLDHFGERYGSMFEIVNFSSIYFSTKYWNKFLIHCTNLKEFVSSNISEIFIEDHKYLPKLEIVNNYQIYSEDEEKVENLIKFDKFCHKFGETVTKIYISIYREMKTKEIESFFNSICKLKHLKDLDMFCDNLQESELGLDSHIEDMAKCLPDLKILSLSLNSPNSLQINNIFNAFKGFYNLIDLYIYIYGYNENSIINGSVECLKSMKNLKYLSISVEIITEEFFADIDKHLPNLSKLVITSESEFTDKTINQLRNFKNLKEFRLNKYRKSNKNITDESVCAMINECPLLEELYFASRPNLTNKTIEALIHCAKTYPKRKLRFECGFSGEEDADQQIPAIDMISFIDKIPENLTIDYIAAFNEE